VIRSPLRFGGCVGVTVAWGDVWVDDSDNLVSEFPAA
jgi:hypothetical protein